MALTPLLLSIILKSGCAGSIPAYIGPGTGLSAVGAILAVAAGIIVAIFGFFWYPIKRLLGKGKKTQEPEPIIEEEE